MEFWAIFLTTILPVNFALPNASHPTVGPNELAFDNCEWVANCDNMSGKIPIPCPGHCDHFLLCIDNHPTMQQCDPITSWLFWKVKTNFNPLSLQCEKDFNTCDWYLNVRLSGNKAVLEDTQVEKPNKTTEFDPSFMKESADSAMEEVLSDITLKTNAAIEQFSSTATAIVESLEEKAREISDQVQTQTLQILQKLKDEEAPNSTQLAQVVIKAIITQIHESSDEAKDGISSIVYNMKQNITGVLSDLKENSVKVVQDAENNLYKLLPDVAEVPPTPVVSTEDNKNETEAQKPEETVTSEVATPAAEPTKPVVEKTVEKLDLEKKSNESATKAQEISDENSKEDMQGDEPMMPPEILSKERNEKAEKNTTGVVHENSDKAVASVGVPSANYFIFTVFILCVVIPQYF